MYNDMHFWTEIRRLVLTKQKSKRAICEEYDLHWKTLQKILNHAEPPGYRQRQPRAKPKLHRFLPFIQEILEQDKKSPRKQRHTIKRIFDRLRTEHGYEGGISVVGDAVRAWRAGSAEVFMPLSHPAGEAQADFGEAVVILQGKQTKVAYFVMTLPFSDAFFCQVFPRKSHRDVSGRPRPGVSVIRWRSHADQLRQQPHRGSQGICRKLRKMPART